MIDEQVKNEGTELFPSLLGARLLEFAQDVHDMRSPAEVINRLHAITSQCLNLNMLSVVRFPRRVNDWDSLILGQTVFLQSNALRPWWDEWIEQVPHRLPVGYALAQTSLTPHTWGENLHLLQSLGIDRWGYELALKYGARDGFTCPVGGRWGVFFWSSDPIANSLTKPARIMIYAASSFAAMQLERLADAGPASERFRYFITPREVAVLRLLSIGTPFREAAETLGLSEETIRTHLKRVQIKLGVRNRTQAVAEAIRQQLIP